MSRYSEPAIDAIAVYVEADPKLLRECETARKLFGDEGKYDFQQWFNNRITLVLWQQGAKLEGLAAQLFTLAISNATSSYYLNKYIEDRWFPKKEEESA